MLKRARKRWKRENMRPNWIGKKVFDELLIYWDTIGFRERSEKAKKMRASEKRWLP